MFVVNAEKNKLTVCGREAITGGAVNTYVVRFVFDSAWDRMDRISVFRTEQESISTALDKNGECLIPWECVQNSHEGEDLYCGVYGMIGNDVVLPTVWACLGQILPGAKLGENAVPSTPSVAEQILAQTTAEREKAEKAAERAEKAAIHQPIIQNGTWWTWDLEAGEYKDTGTEASGGGSGGFPYKIGHGLKVEGGNTLAVNAVSDFSGDNTLPITAAAVQETVGNIEIILGTI